MQYNDELKKQMELKNKICNYVFRLRINNLAYSSCCFGPGCTRMVDCLGTPGAVGMYLDADTGQSLVDSDK